MPRDLFAELPDGVAEAVNARQPRDLFEESGVKLSFEEPKVGGLFGKVPVSKYAQGERNIIGNVFERPAAAIRSMIRGEGYAKGAVNPTVVPTFQEEGLAKYHQAVGDVARKIDNPVFKKAVEVAGTLGGFGVSAGSMALDMATNPADVATSLIPAAPGVKQGMKLLGGTRPGIMLKTAANYPLESVPGKLLTKTKQAIAGNPVKQIAKAEEGISKAVKQGIAKGVRPSVSGKSTVSRTEQYFDRVKEGVKEIVLNKENLGFIDDSGNKVVRSPRTMSEYSQAISATKDKVFQEYTAIAQEAKDAGARFNAQNVVGKLDSVSKDLKYNPQVRNYAKQLIDEVTELNGADPLVVQERVKDLNQSLTGFYAGRVDKAKAQVDASLANLMRDELDNIIEKSTGKQYQTLKNKYGALKAAEKEVNHRATVAMRSAPKNVFDLVDVFSGEKIATGLLTGNMPQVAGGVTMSVVKNIYKRLNDPDRIIEKMFGDVEKLMGKAATAQAKIPPLLQAEIVEQIPTLRQKGIVFKSPETKRIGFRPGLLKAPEKTYGEGFTTRKVKFSDKNKTSGEMQKLRAWKDSGKGDKFLRELWEDANR